MATAKRSQPWSSAFALLLLPLATVQSPAVAHQRGGGQVKWYTSADVKTILGKQIKYHHISGGPVFGPVTCIKYYASSDELIVSVDGYNGRTHGLLLSVTLIEEVQPTSGEVK